MSYKIIQEIEEGIDCDYSFDYILDKIRSKYLVNSFRDKENSKDNTQNLVAEVQKS